MRDYTTCNAIAHIWLRNPRNSSSQNYNNLIEIYLSNVIVPQKKWKDVQPFFGNLPRPHRWRQKWDSEVQNLVTFILYWNNACIYMVWEGNIFTGPPSFCPRVEIVNFPEWNEESGRLVTPSQFISMWIWNPHWGRGGGGSVTFTRCIMPARDSSYSKKMDWFFSPVHLCHYSVLKIPLNSTQTWFNSKLAVEFLYHYHLFSFSNLAF